MAAPEKQPETPETPLYKEGEFDEHTSYSFFFFLCSGALLFVTLWSFWDDEFSRRGFKHFQDLFYKEQYARALEEMKAVNAKSEGKAKEYQREIESEEEKLDRSLEYQRLADEAFEAQIKLDDAKEAQKFEKSRLDEYYYYYKKAQHEDKNFQVQLAKVNDSKKKIVEWDPLIAELEVKRDAAEAALLEYKGKEEALKKALDKIENEKKILQQRMDFYKPFPFIWRPAEIKQAVIPGARKNNFAEITYKVDRCYTCHISYDDPHYGKWEEPLKTHPNLDIYIKKHDPTVTGCTWCHKGQGPATAPAEDAHGSHHETDQTIGINEPLLRGDLMQANCQNCHAPVVDLEGAEVLSRGKRLFIKLGCHGCHLAEGFESIAKVGPRLLRIGAKVDPSWLYRWVKKPKNYLPKTRMPDFSLSDEHALALAAFLLDQSEKGYQLPQKYTGGNPQEGEKLFATVGCLACHQIKGKGEEFGPDLTRIGEKVSPDWLVSWISNPDLFNEESKMPDLNLNVNEAGDIAAYLLQFAEHKRIPGIESKMRDPKAIQLGETLVRRRGCFACHDIRGMEKEGRIAPELSAFGSKQTRVLEFGDQVHIPHNWESWARTKLANPSAFRTERVLDKMPDFDLTKDEIDSLMVLLKGFNGVRIPEKYKQHYTQRELTIERGRRLVERFNCRGCHVVEGSGGQIQKYLKSKVQYPPPLIMGDYQVGERIKGSWLHSFLRNPTPVRTWVKVKMPKFALNEKETQDLTAYFQYMAPMDTVYERGINQPRSQDSINMGVRIVNYMDCGKCHDDGAKGIDFSIASDRLRHSWISKWLKNTRQLIPWTKMPNHWPKKEGQYTIRTKFRELTTVDHGNVDTAIHYITDLLVAYNSADLNFDLELGDESSGGDGSEDEESADEDDADDEEDGEDEADVMAGQMGDEGGADGEEFDDEEEEE
ncbi:MAG: c-type cytochrome [Nitrospinaceae bacterium]